MKLRGSVCGTVHQTSGQGSFTILEARGDFGDDNIAILKLRVAAGDIGKHAGLLEIDASILGDRFHRHERNFVFRLEVSETRRGRIDLHDKTPADYFPMLRQEVESFESAGRGFQMS